MVEDIARLGDHALVVDRVAQAAGDAERVGQFVIELPIHAEAVVIERAREVRPARAADIFGRHRRARGELRSEEHTSELQSLMRISYAVLCLKKNKYQHNTKRPPPHNEHTTH